MANNTGEIQDEDKCEDAEEVESEDVDHSRPGHMISSQSYQYQF